MRVWQELFVDVNKARRIDDVEGVGFQTMIE
jgi:hypothetical protein